MCFYMPLKVICKNCGIREAVDGVYCQECLDEFARRKEDDLFRKEEQSWEE